MDFKRYDLNSLLAEIKSKIENRYNNIINDFRLVENEFNAYRFASCASILTPTKTSSRVSKIEIKQLDEIDDKKLSENLDVPTESSKKSSNSSKKAIIPESLNNYKIEDFEPRESKLEFYRSKVQTALKYHKVFTVYGKFNIIRRALHSRDWVEKCSSKYLGDLKFITNDELLKNCEPGNKYEQALISNLCEGCNPDFIWKSSFKNTLLINLPYRNIIRRSRALNFTTKSGLIGCIENAHWYLIDDISEINVPRVHRLLSNDKNHEFLRDYCTTCCISFLKFLCEQESPIDNVFDKFGTVDVSLIDMAITRIRCELSYRDNEDLNEKSVGYESFDDKNWLYFYDKINNVICNVEKMKLYPDITDMEICLDICHELLKTATDYNLCTEAEGYNNLWILKPAYSCRGNGIVIKKNINEIIYFAKALQKISYIVQKYIERPLLIYKTKFDIRQYIVLSITDTKFNIWTYKNCYLRFSSQEYELSELRKSVHITNNAVQKRFKNGDRSDKLPQHNMWSLKEFQSYLKENKLSYIWDKTIYPGMKKNIITIVLASLEETEFVPNTYQLYGCDFMLDENYEPILLEINANPDVSRSTIVTAKICPAVLEDLIKVVLDLPDDKLADIGEFELIYSINWKTTQQPKLNIKLEVIGKRIKLKRRDPSTEIDFNYEHTKQLSKKRVVIINKKLRKKSKKKINDNICHTELARAEKNNVKCCSKYKKIINKHRKEKKSLQQKKFLNGIL